MGKKTSSQRKTASLAPPPPRADNHLLNFKGTPIPLDSAPPRPTQSRAIDIDLAQKRLENLDLPPLEKEFMQLWTGFCLRSGIKVLKNAVLADSHNATIALQGFMATCGAEIRSKYSHLYLQHILVLYDYGYLSIEGLGEAADLLAGPRETVKREG